MKMKHQKIEIRDLALLGLLGEGEWLQMRTSMDLAEYYTATDLL